MSRIEHVCRRFRRGDVDGNPEQHTARSENFTAKNDGDLTRLSGIPCV